DVRSRGAARVEARGDGSARRIGLFGSEDLEAFERPAQLAIVEQEARTGRAAVALLAAPEGLDHEVSTGTECRGHRREALALEEPEARDQVPRRAFQRRRFALEIDARGREVDAVTRGERLGASQRSLV